MRGILPDRDQRQGNVAQRPQRELQVDRGRLSAWAVEGRRMFVYNSAETETRQGHLRVSLKVSKIGYLFIKQVFEYFN